MHPGPRRKRMADGRMDLQYSIGAPTGKSEGGPGVIGKGEHGAYMSHELRGEPFAPRRLWLRVYTTVNRKKGAIYVTWKYGGNKASVALANEQPKFLTFWVRCHHMSKRPHLCACHTPTRHVNTGITCLPSTIEHCTLANEETDSLRSAKYHCPRSALN